MPLTKNIVFFLLGLIVVSNHADADLYLEFAMEEGSQRMASSRQGPEINAGGGLKFAAGLQLPLGQHGSNSLRLVAGYLFDGFDEAIAEVDMDTMTVDAVLVVNRGPHAFGIGASHHLAPEYREQPAGFAAFTIEFDDTTGALVQYGYQFSPRMELGLRYLDMEYESSGTRIDASSVGVYLSNGF